MLDLSKIFDSVTSPLEVKSGQSVTNDAQKSLSLLFPKPKSCRWKETEVLPIMAQPSPPPAYL